MPGWLENAIRTVSPGWAAGREKARMQLSLAHRAKASLCRDDDDDDCDADSGTLEAQRRRSRRRGIAAWQPLGRQSMCGDPWQTILPQLQWVRQQSRNLYWSEAWFSGSVDRYVNAAIGHGYRPQSQVSKGSGVGSIGKNEAAECKYAIESLWAELAPTIQANGGSFWSLCRKALWHTIIDGDFPLRAVESDANSLGVAFHLDDPWLVDEPPDMSGKAPGGVERDGFGRQVRIHYRRGHHSSDYFALDSDLARVVQADHYAGMARALPRVMQAAGRIFDMNEMQESELVTAASLSAMSMWINTEDALDVDPQGEVKMPGPGTAMAGRGNATVLNPNRPGNMFVPFQEFNLRALAIKLGLPFSWVANNYTQANYSGGRLEEFVARDTMRADHFLLAEQMVRWMWRTVVKVALLKGLLPIDIEKGLDDFENLASLKVLLPSRPIVDPDKDVSAYAKAVAVRFMPERHAIAELTGEDLDDLRPHLVEEKEFADAHDMPYGEAPGMSYRPLPNAAAAPADPASPPDANAAGNRIASVLNGVNHG